ncbi:MAG: VCBS repeat-containing protein [Elusimicrobia bacterium]|nr:VCBS repeat-containing protein [Elusimicrobiota bacterium]
MNGGLYYGGVGWGDYDADGDVDVLVSGNAEVRVYKNNGNGTFDPTQLTVSAAGFIEGDVTWGDYDNDGDLDVVGIGEHGGSERPLHL